MSAASSAHWHAAVARGEDLAPLSIRTASADSWDFVAVRGIVAIAAYCAALRDHTSVEAVPLGRLIVPLGRQEAFVELAVGQMSAAGHAVGQCDPADPVSTTWAWLNRQWDPEASAGQRWDGLRRGIARGSSDPAIEVCLHWAFGAVARAVLAERGGINPGARLTIVGGEYDGMEGLVEMPGWGLAESDTQIEDGPPTSYAVTLGIDYRFRVEWIPAERLPTP